MTGKNKKDKKNFDSCAHLSYEFSKDDKVTVFNCGKDVLCASFIKTMIPFVYSSEVQEENIVKTALKVNKGMKAIGVVAGFALALNNPEVLADEGLLSQPIIREATSSVSMGFGFNFLHCAYYSMKNSKDTTVYLPTVGEFIFGSNQRTKKGKDRDGIIVKAIDRAISHLEKNNPKLLDFLEKDVEKQIDILEDKRKIAKKEQELLKRREDMENSCVIDMRETEKLDKVIDDFYKKHPKDDKKPKKLSKVFSDNLRYIRDISDTY